VRGPGLLLGDRRLGGRGREACGRGDERVRLGRGGLVEAARVRRVRREHGYLVLGEARLFAEVVAVGGRGQEEWGEGEEDQRDHGRESRAAPCRCSAAGHGESV
jgi:hypothetical protein